jgi:hypothetical protein
MPHEIFDDPSWPETIMYDMTMSMFFWNEIWVPIMRNGGMIGSK